MRQLSNTERISALAAQRTTEDLKEILIYLDELQVVKDTNQKLNNTAVNFMFSVYREVWGTLEYATHCGSCRARVFKELQLCRPYLQKEIDTRNGSEEKRD